MNCRDFLEGLDRLVAPEIPDASRLAMEEHAAGCRRCGRLLDLLRREAAMPPDRGPEDLVEGVLARTSGAACGAAREHLAAGWGAPSPGAEGGLVQGHLDHCPGCRRVAVALRWLPGELAAMAEADPGPTFTAAVTRRTAPRRRGWEELWRLLESAWRRPRLAWEVAYVGAIFVALLFGTPSAPFGRVPSAALDLVRANPVRAVGEAAGPVGRDFVARATVIGEQAWNATAGRVLPDSPEEEGLWHRLGRTTVSLRELVSHGGEMCWSFVTGDLETAGDRWRRMGGDLRAAWRAFTGARSNHEGPSAGRASFV